MHPETAGRSAYRPLTSDGGNGRCGVRVSHPNCLAADPRLLPTRQVVGRTASLVRNVMPSRLARAGSCSAAGGLPLCALRLSSWSIAFGSLRLGPTLPLL
jgi:hypothetical protein